MSSSAWVAYSSRLEALKTFSSLLTLGGRRSSHFTRNASSLIAVPANARICFRICEGVLSPCSNSVRNLWSCWSDEPVSLDGKKRLSRICSRSTGAHWTPPPHSNNTVWGWFSKKGGKFLGTFPLADLRCRCFGAPERSYYMSARCCSNSDYWSTGCSLSYVDNTASLSSTRNVVHTIASIRPCRYLLLVWQPSELSRRRLRRWRRSPLLLVDHWRRLWILLLW